MSHLSSSDEPFIATAGADPGRRKAAAHQAHGARGLAVASALAAMPMRCRPVGLPLYGAGLLDLRTIDFLTNGRLGVHDVICPVCAEGRSRRGQPIARSIAEKCLAVRGYRGPIPATLGPAASSFKRRPTT
jgi:hypothetical protein